MGIKITVGGYLYQTHESAGLWQVRRIDVQKKKLFKAVFPRPLDYDEDVSGPYEYDSDKIDKYIKENVDEEVVEKFYFDCCFMPVEHKLEISVLLNTHLPPEEEMEGLLNHVSFFVQNMRGKRIAQGE